MQPNFKKYLVHVDDYDLSYEEKIELLQTMWLIAEGFIDRAHNDDPVQSALAEQTAKCASDSRPVIELTKDANNDFKVHPASAETSNT